MKRLENKKKPWRAKKIGMYFKENDKPYSYGRNKSRRVITGWQKQCGYLATFLGEPAAISKTPPKECTHCPVSTMRPMIGVRPYTKKGICPYMLDKRWEYNYYIWKPIEEQTLPISKVQPELPFIAT